jgi:hypothetical protein
MHARIQSVRTLPTGPEADQMRPKVMDAIAGHPGFIAVYALEQFGGQGHTLVSLWESAVDAERAPERTRAALGPRPFALETDQVHEVVDCWTGSAHDAEPNAAVVLYFDGPMSPELYAAAQRSGRERVIPAVKGLPGLIGGVVMWQAEARSMAILHLGTSMDRLDEAGRVANTTDLLPGEDPALLPGPDRVLPHRVAMRRGDPFKA